MLRVIISRTRLYADCADKHSLVLAKCVHCPWALQSQTSKILDLYKVNDVGSLKYHVHKQGGRLNHVLLSHFQQN